MIDHSEIDQERLFQMQNPEEIVRYRQESNLANYRNEDLMRCGKNHQKNLTQSCLADYREENLTAQI